MPLLLTRMANFTREINRCRNCMYGRTTRSDRGSRQ
ncbi:hypothetical protein DFQ14_102421 [Halopolyspora algeriensis]|uniref:Uncharacterized protein n=1 Tax=Halopolyspora algeriensis TaxID=1500506 RepID=A0A368VW92_9ACTN|nr:hypothetical protein DFQ14_102421 [Halopolyspora algeriensis]TQM55522.1 hypothetical protein FHU43_0296 [Halopolyspora algeriensis]